MAKDIQINLNKILFGTPFQDKDVVVGVALSGGRDSIALCHALLDCGVNVVAVNVEHGIRGQRSIDDSAFVKEFCDKRGIKLYSFCVDAPSFSKENGYTLEQGARILRYKIFDDLLAQNKCDLIALAHHLDDQVETVFMRILRGTGVRGLAGMRMVSGKYIRPLLEYTREDIDCYVKKHNLDYVDDESNLDVAYTRNFLRGEIARLKERFPSICENVSRLSNNAYEDNLYLESLLPDLQSSNGEVFVPIDCLQEGVLAKRTILKACALLGVSQDIEDRHFPLVLDLCHSQNGKYVQLSHGISVHKEGDNLVFVKNDCVASGHNDGFGASSEVGADKIIPFAYGNFEEFGVKIEHVKACDVDGFGGEILYIDADKLPKDAVLRRRMDGDFIAKFGGGSKNIGDFLTDKKVALRKRENLVEIASANEVFAVFGIDISRKVKIDENTKNVAKLTILK